MREKLIRISETAACGSVKQRNNSRKHQKTKPQASFMFFSCTCTEKAQPSVCDWLLVVIGDNFTCAQPSTFWYLRGRYLAASVQYMTDAEIHSSFWVRLDTPHTRNVADVNANQVSLSCTDVQNVVFPYQCESVALHGELICPQWVSHEWLYLAQWERTE